MDRKKVDKIYDLIADCHSHPFIGLGKPEPLKHHLSGKWSRRIDHKNRLIYEVTESNLILISCLGHYE